MLDNATQRPCQSGTSVCGVACSQQDVVCIFDTGVSCNPVQKQTKCLPTSILRLPDISVLFLYLNGFIT